MVVACDDEQKVGLIRNQLPGFHKVVQGDAALVEKINTIGSTEGLRAALTVKAKLAAMNIPDEWIDVAIRTVCARYHEILCRERPGSFCQATH